MAPLVSVIFDVSIVSFPLLKRGSTSLEIVDKFLAILHQYWPEKLTELAHAREIPITSSYKKL